jgi:hypothetical protein
MLKKISIFAQFSALAMTIAAAAMFYAPSASAQINIGAQYAQNIGLGNRNPKDIIVGVIQVILGFLGLLAVILILYGGFKWMLSRGDEGEVESARKIIVAGVIGLLIVLAAWGISFWVIGILANQTGSSVEGI